MAAVFPDEGERWLLGLVKAHLDGSLASLHLFKNDVDPDGDTVQSDLVECDFDGYASINLTPWSTVITVAGKAFTQAQLAIFLCTGGSAPNDVYGYYVLDNTATFVIAAERFPAAPITIDTAGQSVPVQASVSFASA